MAESPIPVAYGYLAVPLLEHRIPYRGRLPARFIEEAWSKVEARFPRWRPDIYQVFVYSLSRASEYQAARVAVPEYGPIEWRKFLSPLDD